MRADEEHALMLMALIAMLGGRKADVEWGAGWMWPVPTLRIGGINYDAVVSDGFGSPRPGNRIHGGVDIMYRRRSRIDLEQQFRANTHDGSPGFIAPPRTPIVAAHDGTLWSCGKTDRGYAVVVSHDGTPWATFYQHLETPSVPLVAPRKLPGGRLAAPVSTVTGQPYKVHAGDPLGFMGFDPTDGASSPRHLHFETWWRGPASNAVDPEAAMQTWARPPFIFKP